jgi:hypothetical protein
VRKRREGDKERESRLVGGEREGKFAYKESWRAARADGGEKDGRRPETLDRPTTPCRTEVSNKVSSSQVDFQTAGP